LAVAPIVSANLKTYIINTPIDVRPFLGSEYKGGLSNLINVTPISVVADPTYAFWDLARSYKQLLLKTTETREFMESHITAQNELNKLKNETLAEFFEFMSPDVEGSNCGRVTMFNVSNLGVIDPYFNKNFGEYTVDMVYGAANVSIWGDSIYVSATTFRGNISFCFSFSTPTYHRDSIRNIAEKAIEILNNC